MNRLHFARFAPSSNCAQTARRSRNTAALAGAVALLAPVLGAVPVASAAGLYWDPGLAGGTGSGGNGNWDSNASNTVWYNGTADVAYATNVVTFGGTAGTVNVDASVTATSINYATSGYDIAGTSTLTIGSSGAISTGTLVNATETIAAPISLATGSEVVDGTLTFSGAILGGNKPVFGASTNVTGSTLDPATYVFSGDLSQYTGTAFTIGGGNTVASLDHIVTMVYSSTVVSPTAGVGAGVLGPTNGSLVLAYQANLQVSAPLIVPGDLNLNGGGQQGLGDLSQNGETVSGTAPIDIGFNPNNSTITTVANGISGNPVLAFIGSNVGAFLTNNLTAGNTLTIGQAGAATAATLSGTNAGREITFAGSGTTVINSEIFDGNKNSINYVNSTLGYNGTGTLILTSSLNSYKGATDIEQGTVKLGANNALPTGQGLPSTATGGTPGLILFGDVDPTKNAGGILDLAGYNQTVAGLGIQQTGTVPAALQTATMTVGAANAAGTSSIITVTGFAPYNSGLAVGEGITVGGQSGTILSLANGGGTSQTLAIGLSFDPAAGAYTIAGGGVVLTSGAASASNQIIGNSSTTSNSTLTFAGGNSFATTSGFLAGEGVSSTSTFGGIIKDSVNGGTMKVALNVTGGTLNLTGNNTYTGGTTVNGANGAVLNVAGLIANDTSAGVFIGDTASFGTNDNLIKRAVANGGSYNGLGATEIGGYGTKIDLLQGGNVSNGAPLSVAMEVRQPSATDLSNLPAFATGLSSDVLGLTGMVIGGATSGQTDPFALQMSYDGLTLHSTAPGSIYLAYTNNAESIPFSNAVNGDFATGPDAVTDVQSSYAAFALANGITDANIANYLGSWGVDTTGSNAWAIVDHNSQFAVVSVPEPATAGVLAGAAIGLLSRRRRSRR